MQVQSTFIFFSTAQVAALTEAAMQLLAWCGDDFIRYYSRSTNILERLNDDQKLPKQTLIELSCLLGHCTATSRQRENTLQLYTICTETLAVALSTFAIEKK